MKRARSILLACVLDLSFGDPSNQFHPVSTMGRWLIIGRHIAPARYRFLFGLGWNLLGLGLFALPWTWLARLTGRVPDVIISITEAGLLKPTFAYRNLHQAVIDIQTALAANDLGKARRLLSWHLVSRDTSTLSAAEVAGAAIESLAEKLTDNLLAPLLAYALGGLPAAWTYRFANTADAMWGYRTEEFEQMGKFPARLDDVLNWLPARLMGWLIVAAAGLSGADPLGAARTMLGQYRRSTGSNAGWTTAAMAGALGITVDKRSTYTLSGGPATPDFATLTPALRLADLAAGLAVLAACLLTLGRD
jgi:adenosylcobinamide-phosphate synthase